MQTKITKIFNNQITTKYGPKIKYDVYVEVNGQEFKFQAWQGNWNMNWAVGTEIDLPPTTNSRWKVAPYNGKEYYTLSAPADTQYQGYSQSPQNASVSPQNYTGAPNVPQQAENATQELSEPLKTSLHKIDEKLDRILDELFSMGMKQAGIDIEEDIPTITQEGITQEGEEAKINEDFPF